jgi:hypothetical protein
MGSRLEMCCTARRLPGVWSSDREGNRDLGAAVFLLRGSVALVARQATAGTMVPHLTEQFRFQLGYSPPRSEVVSWERSIPALLGQLMDAGLDEVEVLVEYRLPLTSRRADVVLLGEHPKGGPSCVVVENKQWSRLDERFQGLSRDRRRSGTA